MLNLISVWPLKNGCPQELLETLKTMPAKIIESEQGTISYAINLPGNNPLSEQSESRPLTDVTESSVTEIIFIESYDDAAAFNTHLNSCLFTDFRLKNIHYFIEDPDKSGWPDAQTQFLDPIASQQK